MSPAAAQRTAIRAANPHRDRLDEIDDQLDTIAADAAAYAEEAKQERWALMKERAGLTCDTEKGLNLLRYIEDWAAAEEKAKGMTIKELCEFAMEHVCETDLEIEAVLSEIYERLGYRFEEEQP